MKSALPPAARPLRALLMLLLANFFWGLSFPVIKAMILLQGRIAPGAGSALVTALLLAPRFLLALGFLLLLRPRVLARASGAEWRQGLLIASFAGAGLWLQNDGLRFTAASTSAFLTQLYAILIPLYLAFRARRNPGTRVWLSAGLVLAGIALLGRFDWRTLQLGRGEVETLLGSVFFMGQILALERPEFAATRPGAVTGVMFLFLAFGFGADAMVAAPGPWALLAPWHSTAWTALAAVLALFSTLGAYSLMNAWQPRITAIEAGLIYCFEPIFGSILALFLPALLSAWTGIGYADEHATVSLLAGGSLITLGNILIQLRPPQRLPA